VPESASIQGFLDRLNLGTESAVGELYNRYVEQLCRIAVPLIGERLQRHYSAEDAAHSALASAFRGINERRYRFDESGKLWALLVTILRHKIQKRGGKHPEFDLDKDVVCDAPSHEEAIALTDAVEMAMVGLKKPRHLEICRLCYAEELSTPEIADRVGCTRWTVRRVLDEFGARLENCLDRGSKP
jgi:RNA polymerase sigma factor (sigma-70 family)